ncbi:MAG TPA: DUF5916 domain-containing protein, partial [Longimicrobiales bacterium]|nr:DUF5916 domain-containing protein [Longimicrobiales bacterium]
MVSSRVRPQLKIIFQHASLFALAALVVASGPVSGQTSGRQAREAEGAAEEAAPLRGPARGPDAREPADLPVGPAEPVPPPGRRIEYPVRPAASAIDVDGRLEEPGWLAAEPIPLPWETAPGDNAPAPVRTECYVTFDEERLYLACVARDPDPDRIRAYITDRDDTEGHDRVVFALDPFDDARRAFEFGVSALGVQSDAVFEEQSGESDASWDAIWSSAGRIAPEGWVVEAAIPFRSLRFPAGGDRAWGFHVRREWPRSDRVETRSMHWDRDRACQLCQANRVTGISGVSPGLDVELVPTLTARVAEARRDFPAGELEGPGPEPEVGLDARWGVTTDLTLNATLNPDFSQVEADAPQLDANTRFALFFPEKRPFFLEGAELFRTPVEAVFTRTVVDPVVGMKATGKLGASAVGAMVALDETNVLLLPGNQGSESVSLDQRVLSAVGRFRRDVGASGTVGALYTARVADGYGNHV